MLVTFKDPDSSAEFPFVAGIHFPNPTGDGKIKLTVFAQCKDADAQQTAERILKSITFP